MIVAMQEPVPTSDVANHNVGSAHVTTGARFVCRSETRWPSDFHRPGERSPYPSTVAQRRSYLLCGTPRTGSTLLCSLLSSTGVLGHPESYFREPDEWAWARRFGLRTDGARVHRYGAFVAAVRAAGTSSNGVLAARIMWGSLERVMEGLGKPGNPSDLVTLEEAFGPLAFVHLQRQDVIAQAVSWCRAEQTGLWQHGDAASRSPGQDLPRMKELVRIIGAHNAAWRSWFDRHGVQAHAVSYEELVRDPRSVVAGIADLLGVKLPARWQPASPHEKQADEINAAWIAALQAVLHG